MLIFIADKFPRDYHSEKVNIYVFKVSNPFDAAGHFRVVLVESADADSPVSRLTNSIKNSSFTSGAPRSAAALSSGAKGSKLNKVKSKIDHGLKTKTELDESYLDETVEEYVPNDPEILLS